MIKKGLHSTIVCNYLELKAILNIRSNLRSINSLLKEDSLWKDMPRKSLNTRRMEIVKWFFKHKEICIYYNSYGFDIVGFRNQADYLPYRDFRIQRFYEDYPHNIYESKLCVLRDKILFSAFFSDILGDRYVVKTQAILYPDGHVYDFITKTDISFQSYIQAREKDTFIKKLDGECGEGCYLIHSGSNVNEIMSRVHGSKYIIQDRIEQNDIINCINSSCINTIRIITIIGGKSGLPYVFAHYMRVGCNAINDNRATGGVGVGITDDGFLYKYGVGHHKVEYKHSVTNYVYEGTKIPYWKEVKELAIRAHKAISDIPTIGWDVAITPNGPVLIEGNDNWEISGAQDSVGGLKERWYELHEM